MNPITENPDTFHPNALDELKKDALHMVARCIECGSCYVDCAFGNYGDDPAECQAMIRESNDFLLGKIDTVSDRLKDATLKCAECNRCFSSCPEGIYRRHGNMMMKHMLGNPLAKRLNIHPFSNWRVKQPAIEKTVIPKWPAREQDWYRNTLNRLQEADVLLYHGCYVYLQAAQILRLEEMLDAAGVSWVSVGKLEYCCGSFGFYRGHSDMEKIRPRFFEMMEVVKPKRILTNCGHCFNAMSDLVRNLDWPEEKLPPVRHAAEELLDLATEGKLDFAHIGETYTVHDACNFRSLHDGNSALRRLIRRIGSIHEMLSHGKGSKCCGDVSRYYAPGHIDADNRKVKTREFVSSGCDHMLTVCAGCFESFHGNPQLRVMDFIDLAYKAYAKAKAEDAELAQRNVGVLFENMSPVIEANDKGE